MIVEDTRFKFTNIPDFELLNRNTKRIKVVYFDENIDETYKNKLKIL